MANEEKVLLSWELTKEKKDNNTILLIIVVFLVAIGAMIYYFYQKEYFTAMVFIVLSLVLAWYFFVSHGSASIAITTNGFKINNQLYKFDRFKSYWVSGKTGVFYFEPKGRIGSITSMPAGTKKAEDIIMYLPEYLIETEDKGDDFSNQISAIFKI